jgi:hypothetical protein
VEGYPSRDSPFAQSRAAWAPGWFIHPMFEIDEILKIWGGAFGRNLKIIQIKDISQDSTESGDVIWNMLHVKMNQNLMMIMQKLHTSTPWHVVEGFIFTNLTYSDAKGEFLEIIIFFVTVNL